MASLTFQDSDIRKINPKLIPPVFLVWYQAQSESRKTEIRRLNPRLAAAIAGEPFDDGREEHPLVPKTLPVVSVPSPGSSAVEPPVPDSPAGEGDTADTEEDTVQDAWESVPVRKWREKNVDVPVLVCKLMPDGNRVCRFHSPRVALEERYLKFRTPGGKILGAHGYYCPECLDFYMEQAEFDETIPGIAEAGIAGLVQPLTETLDEWARNGVPNDWDSDTPIYYTTRAWSEQETVCPIHPEVILRPDDYRLRYKDRELVFQAYYCDSCGKLIMGKARAGQLEEECGEKGIPSPFFSRLQKETGEKRTATRKRPVRPDEKVVDGRRESYREAVSWDLLGEEDTVVISDAAACPEWDHEDQWEDVWRVVRVMEKRGGATGVLVPLCYCGECERYYAAQKNVKTLLTNGRPEVQLLDETDSISRITSGGIFQSEKCHLQELENSLDAEISKIQGQSRYTGQYEVNHYGYDDGNLAIAKHQSRTAWKQIEMLDKWKPKPYGYRVDLTRGTETRTLYLGAAEINLSSQKQVMNYNTKLGRELVNTRTESVRMPDGKEYHLKLWRWFDIEKAQLFGFEERDDSSEFSVEFQDSFLRKVLHVRRRQHQLLDIIATIQKEQNAIIDLPLSQNLVVQGCAGSGKTMVMLHRLAALQADNGAFLPETTLILTPSHYFNLHIKGLAESLQIQYITRYSIERYYAAVLEAYDSSFRVNIDNIANEMELKNQARIDALYSDRFFQVLIEETDAAMWEFQEYLQETLPVPFEVPRTGKGAQLLPILRDAVNRNAREVEAKENAFQQWTQEHRRLEKRYGELDDNLPKLEADARRTAMEEVSRAKKRLETEITDIENQMRELSAGIASDEEEVQRLEKTLFTLNKSRKISALREKIASSQAELRQFQRTLENLSAIPDFMSLSLEELPGQLEQASIHLPELRIHGQVIHQRLRLVRDTQQERESVGGQLEQARQELERALSERYEEEERHEIENLKTQFGSMTLKSLYERTANMAAKREKISVPARSKVYRYNLYLQLRFALYYFGMPQKRYSLICIDEGQDLTESEYRLLRDLNGSGTSFNIFGDIRQLLKTGRGIDDWSRVSKSIPNLEIRTLNENYRNTNQITEHCNETFHMQMIKTGMDGTQVKQMYRGELEDTLSRLRVGEDRVAVIVPRSVNKESYLHLDALSPDVRGVIGEDTGPGKIALVYVDEVKGVEFDRVFVIPNSMSENERYIAFTRALSHLTLVDDYSLDAPENDLDSPDTGIEEERSTPSPHRKSAEKRRPLSGSGKIDYGKVRKRPRILDGARPRK